MDITGFDWINNIIEQHMTNDMTSVSVLDISSENEEQKAQLELRKQKHTIKTKVKTTTANTNNNEVIKKCEYFHTKRKRRCGLQVRDDLKYCYAHMSLLNNSGPNSNVSEPIINENEVTRIRNGKVYKRVKCPVDPSHTIWEDKLTKHVKHCNVIKAKAELQDKIKNCDWFEVDYNIKDVGVKSLTKNSDIDIDNDDFMKFIEMLMSQYRLVFGDDDCSNQLQLNKIEYKKGLEERFSELTNQKHVIQQSSLIGQLVQADLFDSSNMYIEFGCGRAEFSRYLNKALITESTDGSKQQHKFRYLLIDRESPRLKFDKKMVKDYIEITKSEPSSKVVDVQRLKADIKDLKLLDSFKKFNISKSDEIVNYVGISKHLCGVATDLTLRCLANAINDTPTSTNATFHFKGFLVAMCCRHCCSYDHLLPESKSFLKDNFNVDSNNFKYMRKMFSWATNGMALGLTKDEGHGNGLGHFTGMDLKQRKMIGLNTRRILDESRKFAMSERGFKVKLVKYVESEVSLENNCLLITN